MKMKEVEKENTHGKTEAVMKDFGIMVKDMVKVFLSMNLGENSKKNGEMVKL